MMDSGSSGSMQSSSGGGGAGGGAGGGDEEYNSRGGESISTYLNQHQSSHFISISNQQLPPPLQLSHHQQSTNNLHLHHHNQQQQPAFFDLHPQSLEAFPQSLSTTQSANLQFNNEMVWSRPLRSEPNFGNFGKFTTSNSSSSLSLSSSSSLPSSTQSVFGINQTPPLQPSSVVEPTRASSSSQLDHHHPHHQPNLAVKNPKKRTRASRRAPTTVLTTDTANFRQMVQEFTGIPAAPFSAAASPYSRRFDLFSTAGGGGGGVGGSALGSLYNHPFRPSAQKVPFISSSLSTTTPLLNINNSGDGTTNNTSSIAGTSNTLGLQKQPQNLFNMHNQLLTFQPLLQQQSNLPPSMGNDQAFYTTRSQGTTMTNTTTAIDELGMNHHHQQQQQQQINANNLGGFLNPGRSEAMNDDNLRRFGGRNEAFDHGNGRNSFMKLNSSSSSEFYSDKVLENGSSGGTEFRNYNNN